ncbi:MAG: T9SS type A sorting domain-containing protein [Saprospiraceae bacterium]|nr:T9SS type A sorting domain-containing protein [Saprospiraceae bacterium]
MMFKTKFSIFKAFFTLFVCFLTWGNKTNAQVNFNTIDVAVTQNFDGMGGAPFELTNNTSLAGVYAFRTIGNATPNIFTNSAGGVNSGNLYNFGTASTATDRAMGGIQSSVTGVINYGVRYKNNTTMTITALLVTYTGEEWRTGTGNVVNTLAFDYRQAPSVTDLTSGIYNSFSALSFDSPIISATGGALDGNLAANRVTLTATIPVNIPPGEEIMLRWTDIDDSLLDCALAIDDLSVTPKVGKQFYYDGTGSLTNLTNWGANPDGTGANPPDFVSDGQIFEIRNTTSVTIDATWTVSGAGSKVILGNATTPSAPITLTLNANTAIAVPNVSFDVSQPASGNHKVIYKNSGAISFGTIKDPNLELEFDGATITTTTTKTYGNVRLMNNATIDMISASPTIKNLTIDAGSTLTGGTATSRFITIPAGGSVVINGTFKTAKAVGFVSSNVGTSATTFGAIQFIGAENLTLGTNSIIEFSRGSTGNIGTQTVDARSDYKNLTLSNSAGNLVSNKVTAGAINVSGVLTINTLGADTLKGNVTTGTLTMTSGKVFLGINNITAANIAGGSPTAYVVTDSTGNLTRTNFTATTLFPIGTTTYYTPATVTNAATARSFSAKVTPSVLNPTDATKIVNLQWDITPSVSTGNNAALVLQWHKAAQATAFSPTAPVHINHYNSTTAKWDYSSVATVTAPNDTTYTATASGFTNFSPFAVSNVRALATGIFDVNTEGVIVGDVFPNPAIGNKIWLPIATEQAVDVYYALFDVTGQLLVEKKLPASQGKRVIELDFEPFINHLVFIQVKIGSSVYTRRFISIKK